jgi:hypothetical protein
MKIHTNKINKKLIIFALLLSIILISGCTKAIKDVKSDTYLDKEVTIKGTVQSTIKLGTFSGYSLVDVNGDEIGILSDELPKEGTSKKVSGTLKKLPIINTYYIDTK